MLTSNQPQHRLRRRPRRLPRAASSRHLRANESPGLIPQRQIAEVFAITEVLYFGRISPEAEQLLELTRKGAIKVDIKIGPTGKPYVPREQMRFFTRQDLEPVKTSR